MSYGCRRSSTLPTLAAISRENKPCRSRGRTAAAVARETGLPQHRRCTGVGPSGPRQSTNAPQSLCAPSVRPPARCHASRVRCGLTSAHWVHALGRRPIAAQCRGEPSAQSEANTDKRRGSAAAAAQMFPTFRRVSARALPFSSRLRCAALRSTGRRIQDDCPSLSVRYARAPRAAIRAQSVSAAAAATRAISAHAVHRTAAHRRLWRVPP